MLKMSGSFLRKSAKESVAVRSTKCFHFSVAQLRESIQKQHFFDRAVIFTSYFISR